MSAIFGIYSLNGQPLSLNSILKMQETYSNRYQFDRIAHWKSEKVALGCGQQWVTSESIHEKLPFQDSIHDLVITADAIIDNRAELFQKLAIHQAKQPYITDSELILLSYSHWGEDCVQYLIGDFAFVIWDQKEEKLFVARDHRGARTIVYYQDDAYLYLATTEKPIVELVPIERNDDWYMKYLIFPLEYEKDVPYSTRWKGVHHLPPAHTLIVRGNKMNTRRYWKLERNNLLQLSSDEEYQEAFRDVLSSAVQSATRTFGNVGIQLSSGLDSSTVAAFAAPLLKNQGKDLFSFTHVPLQDYSKDDKRLVNEQPLVEKILALYSNITPYWIENKDLNAYNVIDKWLEIIESPYIFLGNAPWMFEVFSQSQNNNLKVMLTGQIGNGTISFGELYTIMAYYRQQKNVVGFLNEVYHLSKKHHVSLVKGLKMGIKSTLIERMRIMSLKALKKDLDAFLPKSLIQKSENKFGMPHTFDPIEFMYELNKPEKLHAIGSTNTSISLHFNQLVRDPTSDVRVMNFMASLPYEQFVYKGVHKRILRHSLTGLLPKEILKINREKGIQSADWIYRLTPNYKEIFQEFRESVENNTIKGHLNKTLRNKNDEELQGYLNNSLLSQMIFRTIIIDRIERRWHK